MAAGRSLGACVVLILAFGVVSGCVSGPPPGEEPIQIEKKITVQRPPASALPQEDTKKDYAALLQTGYAFIGEIYYKNFQFGATENGARKAAQEEAQKYGADTVWLVSYKTSETVKTAAYSRTFHNETNTTTWTSPGGYKDYPYLYAVATLFALDKELASRQLRDLEQRRTAYRKALETLRKKTQTVDQLWKSYESSHSGIEESRHASFVVLLLRIQAKDPLVYDLSKYMGETMYSYWLSKYWVVDPSTKRITGVVKDCGDRKAHLEALLDASNYFDENKEALSFQANVPK